MALNFPASPNDGDTYENYQWNATVGAWQTIEDPSSIGDIGDVAITTPADGESLVYDSASGNWVNADATVEVYGVDTTATDYFMIPVGGDADRPVTPANGHIRFNTDLGEPEYYSEDAADWFLFRQQVISELQVQYLVIAGGGGGGGDRAGGGGAGGYRSSVSGESSGGGASAETPITAITGTSYTVTIGGGGAPGVNGSPNSRGASGSNSIFNTVTSIGGGGGGGRDTPTSGLTGGSGGGAANGGSPGAGTSNQGFGGGSYASDAGGGGGGASAIGLSAGGSNAGNGGSGVSSSITGSAVGRAGGGGGGTDERNGGSGGIATDGGGDGGDGAASAVAGTLNTGGGGGGGRLDVAGASGASGIVILKYPSNKNVEVGPGLISSTATVGEYKVTQFTGGTDTITFS